MKIALADGVDINIERGPDWLFVHLHPPESNWITDETELTERLWELLRENFVQRMVVELHDFTVLSSSLLGQLIALQKRLAANGGILRICGLSPACAELLLAHRWGDRLVPYATRHDAVLGRFPGKPR